MKMFDKQKKEKKNRFEMKNFEIIYIFISIYLSHFVDNFTYFIN